MLLGQSAPYSCRIQRKHSLTNRTTTVSGNIYCRFCYTYSLPLNNSPFLAYIWLTFINVIDSSPAFMGMRSDLF